MYLLKTKKKKNKLSLMSLSESENRRSDNLELTKLVLQAVNYLGEINENVKAISK
jgi:hypothetical protein